MNPGQPAQAIATFTKLTEDFPELPEPYNDLAVLHAAQGDYDKARAALEMAIRTNPGYATAHENLGDIYARLASQAYCKALQLEVANATVKVQAGPNQRPMSRDIHRRLSRTLPSPRGAAPPSLESYEVR